MSAKRVLVGLVAGFLLTTGCAQERDSGESTSATTSNIVGGKITTKHGNVGYLRLFSGDPSQGFGFCTGTVIAPNIVITAAHCAYENDDPTQPKVTQVDFTLDDQPDLNAAIGGGDYITATITPNPAYTGADDGSGQDVSIVVLDSSVDVTPMPLGNVPPVGASGKMIGYGTSDPSELDANGNSIGDDGSGIKREVVIPITSVSDHEFVGGHDGLGGCHGDSGGPLIYNGNLVGLTSWGAEDCHSATNFTRVDDIMDFIADQIDAAPSDDDDDDDGATTTAH